MKNNITQEMVEYCRQLGTGEIKPKRKAFGLCDNFNPYFNIIHRKSTLEYMIDFTQYPNFSGITAYPIKSFSTTSNPFNMYLVTNDKWNRYTKYGRERYKFCLWCADELERLMNKQEVVK